MLTKCQPPAQGCRLWDAVLSRHCLDCSPSLRGAGVCSPPSPHLDCSTLPFVKGDCSLFTQNMLFQQPWQTPTTFQDPAQAQLLKLTLTWEAFPVSPQALTFCSDLRPRLLCKCQEMSCLWWEAWGWDCVLPAMCSQALHRAWPSVGAHQVPAEFMDDISSLPWTGPGRGRKGQTQGRVWKSQGCSAFLFQLRTEPSCEVSARDTQPLIRIQVTWSPSVLRGGWYLLSTWGHLATGMTKVLLHQSQPTLSKATKKNALCFQGVIKHTALECSRLWGHKVPD